MKAAEVRTVEVVVTPPKPLVLVWDCANGNAQTFQFISCTNLATPVWSVITNVVNQTSVVLPNRYANEFITIGKTWLTVDPAQQLKWEGW